MAGTLWTRKAGAAFAVAVFGLVLICAPGANAQLGKVDQKCRNTVAKSFAKALGAANKVSTGCHKGRNADKIPSAIDCNDLSPGQADSKSKFQKAKLKLQGSITKSCTDAGASSAVLDMFLSCPEPCGTETGVSNPLANFGDLGQCLACLAGDVVERRNSVMLGSPAAPLSKEEQKCHGAIGKGYAKHIKTLLKERQGCQKDEDAAGNNALQPCDAYDLKGKIAAALTSAAAGLDAAGCASVNLSSLDSCDNASLAALKACLAAEDNARGDEAFAAGYELAANICPSALSVRSHAGFGLGGATSATRLESGWTGVGHGQDLVDLYQYGVALSCPNSGPPCGTCNITGFTDTGVQSGAFTRCREDTRIECSNPFGTDGVCPGLQECAFYLGPPLPLSASNTPVCVLIRATQDIGGTADVETGDTDFDLALRAVVYSGISLVQPCPRCVGDPAPQDGVRGGMCNGGGNHGALCDTQGFDATFGDTSMDCVPIPMQNISGQGLLIEASFTTATTSMPFNTSCDFPLAAFDCACAVCSGDPSVGCNSNQECIDIGAGSCTSNGGGAPRSPNGCSDLTCTDIGSERGECANGPDVKYCDGQLRANNKGLLTCSTNADCVAVSSVCDGGDCGNCELVEPRSCFLDPIESSGSPDPLTPVIGGTFCTPPTSSSGVNNTAGLPGPSRVHVQLEVERNY